MRKYLLTLLTICTFSLALQNVIAQTPANYENISTAQGLSQGMIFDMIQDKEGFIWLATKEGLNRYDGYTFKVFTYDAYNPHSISSNTIRTLFEDSKGKIWAGTLNAGINVYDKKSGNFRRIMNQPDDPLSLSGNRMRSSTVELTDGRILVLPENGGLNIISLPADYFEKDIAPRITKLELPNHEVAYGIGKDNKGNIWVGCADKKIYLLNASTLQFKLLCDGIKFMPAIKEAGNELWCNRDVLKMDTIVYRPIDSTFKILPGAFNRNEAGQLSIGNFGTPPLNIAHSFFYDINKWKPGMPLQEARAITFTSGIIYLQCLMFDRAGIVWAGTNGFGLNKYNLAANRFNAVLPGFSSRIIIPIGKNNLLVTGWQKEIWTSTEGKLVNNPLPADIKIVHDFRNLINTKNGDYWLWTFENVLVQYDASGKKLASYTLKLSSISDDKLPLFEDSKGNIWVCAIGGTLVRINPSTGNVSYFNINKTANVTSVGATCTEFYEDSKGVFWMGTEEGFAQLTITDNSDAPVVKWYKNSTTSRNSLSYNHVSGFLDDPVNNNYLWISTKGGGLNRLEKTTGNFIHLAKKDGLPNDVIYGILSDGGGNIWGSTNNGIFCMLSNKEDTTAKQVFRNFGKGDGLQSDEFNTGSYLKLANGNLVFGGVNGLNIFDPREVLVQGFSPKVFITKLMVNNELTIPGDKTGILQNSIEETNSIELSPGQDILTLEFSSLDFTVPEQNKYRYQMVGVDEDWIESDNRRSATFLHLPPGSYTFKVQGSNSQGLWSSHTAILNIHVLPPWWLTWWAYVGYILIIMFAIVAYFRITLNRTKLKARLHFEQQETQRAKELDVLKTQLYTNITHEFRTPLTVILGMAQQVVTNPKEHLNNGMEMIIRSGQNLLRLVNEMLDLSKLESGKMFLQFINGDVINFLHYVAESFQSFAQNQKKQLHFLSEIDVLYVSYDAEKLRQVLSNLLANAVKFTPENGNIYISASEEKLPNDNTKTLLVIKIKDTGIGIAESEMQNIFDRFYQSDNSHTRNAEGTGIGLALTKELVKLMQGDITVKSPPAGSFKGTEFKLVLPVQKTMSDDIIANPLSIVAANNENVINIENSVTDKQTSENNPLILLVEDNADVVAYTASCLPDYRLAVGKNGMEGVDIATATIPDLIITDVMMPVMDGFELCHKLKTDQRTSHIPLIMLTAKADIESKTEGLERGADAYLAKPFNRNELITSIKKLLASRKQLQQYYLKQAGVLQKTSSEDVVITEENKLIEELATEDVFVQKVHTIVTQHISNTELTVKQLCKEMYMSHSQLHRKLEALTGLSPNKFIRTIRINKAKELLKDKSAIISAVAMECGFADPGYFARIFKQEFGLTPQEWRLQNRTADVQ